MSRAVCHRLPALRSESDGLTLLQYNAHSYRDRHHFHSPVGPWSLWAPLQKSSFLTFPFSASKYLLFQVTFSELLLIACSFQSIMHINIYCIPNYSPTVTVLGRSIKPQLSLRDCSFHSCGLDFKQWRTAPNLNSLLFAVPITKLGHAVSAA